GLVGEDLVEVGLRELGEGVVGRGEDGDVLGVVERVDQAGPNGLATAIEASGVAGWEAAGAALLLSAEAESLPESESEQAARAKGRTAAVATARAVRRKRRVFDMIKISCCVLRKTQGLVTWLGSKVGRQRAAGP
ncbi:hypothetical protein ADK75_07345, partial [Streptomyces virginiae]